MCVCVCSGECGLLWDAHISRREKGVRGLDYMYMGDSCRKGGDVNGHDGHHEVIKRIWRNNSPRMTIQV